MGFCSTAHLVQDRQRPAALVRVFGGSQPIMMVICHLAWVVPHCYGPSTSLPGRLISVHEVLCVRGINKQLRDEISYPILAIFFFPLCVCFPIMTGIGTDRCCSQVLPPCPLPNLSSAPRVLPISVRRGWHPLLVWMNEANA